MTPQPDRLYLQKWSDHACRMAGIDGHAYLARHLELKGRTAPVGVRAKAAANPS